MGEEMEYDEDEEEEWCDWNEILGDEDTTSEQIEKVFRKP